MFKFKNGENRQTLMARIKEMEAGSGEVRIGSLMAMDPRGGQVELPGEHMKEPAFGLPGRIQAPNSQPRSIAIVGLGEGGEQNAPLGRAVIGGLVLATAATLLFVPVGVGVMTHLALVGQYGVRMLLVIALSTWIGLAVTGWFSLPSLLRRMTIQWSPTRRSWPWSWPEIEAERSVKAR